MEVNLPPVGEILIPICEGAWDFTKGVFKLFWEFLTWVPNEEKELNIAGYIAIGCVVIALVAAFWPVVLLVGGMHVIRLFSENNP